MHPATTYLYTLSLHDALPIYPPPRRHPLAARPVHRAVQGTVRRPLADDERRVQALRQPAADRKSTRLNSSHLGISYAVFCLKKKKKKNEKTKSTYTDSTSNRR